MSIEFDVEIKKSGNPLVRITCKDCGDKFILRGSINKDGSLTSDAKMCFCGSENIKLTLAN